MLFYRVNNMDFMGVIDKINTVFSDNVLIFLLLGAGIYFTVKTRFVQGRYLCEGLKNILSGSASKGGKNTVSPFAALATALAAQLGTGNIAGAGICVITGGPGAVFWMWVSSFFGMATAYLEAYFSIKTREIKNGSVNGGTVYYIRAAFPGKRGQHLCAVFSLFAMTGLGLTGVGVQANSISLSLENAFGIPLFVTGALITLLSGIIIFSGTRAVARVSEKTVPLMAFLYVSACIIVLVINIERIPAAFSLIFRSAFSPAAVRGFIAGLTIRKTLTQGIKRGLFTNEAGMGSSPFAHALSDTDCAHFQGTLGIAGVFIDTFVMFTLTAVCIITVLFVPFSGNIVPSSGIEAACLAFSSFLGNKGASAFVSLSILFFAFASVLGWNLYGKSACSYLFGKKSERLFILSSLAFVFAGSCMNSSVIWGLTDVTNTLMVLINIPALIKLVHDRGRIGKIP